MLQSSIFFKLLVKTITFYINPAEFQVNLQTFFCQTLTENQPIKTTPKGTCCRVTFCCFLLHRVVPLREMRQLLLVKEVLLNLTWKLPWVVDMSSPDDLRPPPDFPFSHKTAKYGTERPEHSDEAPHPAIFTPSERWRLISELSALVPPQSSCVVGSTWLKVRSTSHVILSLHRSWGSVYSLHVSQNIRHTFPFLSVHLSIT